ncbi:hypothetical protein N7G274_009529 [Stereocaulon virgatum]|uniref:DUF4005 domain-containing protein n=1 Tax=Stereocaulon virgatum TaxID=373712 RepID=A0ABR3ZZ41_9LECA
MLRLRKNRKNDSSKSFIMHGFRQGPISHTKLSSSLSGLPNSHRPSTPSTIHESRRPEPSPLQVHSAQRPRGSMPVPIHSQREQPDTDGFISTSWSEEDDSRFSSNLRQTDQTNTAEHNQSGGPVDRSHPIESDQDHDDGVRAADSNQPYQSTYRRQIYKAYRPAGIRQRGYTSRYAGSCGSKPLAHPGFPTLAGSYQNRSVATGQPAPNQPKRHAFPHILRAGRSDRNSLRGTADEQYTEPVLQGSARLSQSFDGRKRKRDSRRSYASLLEQLELPAEAFLAL